MLKYANNSQIDIGVFMKYNTKQRELLLEFFNKNHDKNFSADEIVKMLNNTDISASAVYRNLAQLESDGKIRKISKTGSRKAFYQFVDCDECKDHLHLTCVKCGSTCHLDCKHSSIIAENVLQNARFNLDKNCTILYGVCDKCSK